MWIRNNSRHTTMRILLMAMWIQSSCWCACSKPPPSFHFNFNFYFSVWGRLTPDGGQQVWYGGDLQWFWPRLWPDYEKKWHMQLLSCNAYCYSIYITSDKGPLIAQKFKFLHTVALNKNYDHIVQIDTLRSIHACHGETKKLKVMCLHSSDG